MRPFNRAQVKKNWRGADQALGYKGAISQLLLD
jgi:hypothetical protein